MKECDCCHAHIGEYFATCPICGMDHRDSAVPETALYPACRHRRMTRSTLRRSGVGLILFAFVICTLINFFTGGEPWCVYVYLSGYVFYTLFLAYEPVESSLIQRLISVGIAVSALLVVIERLGTKGNWATQTAVPMLMFGILAVCAVLYFVWFDRQRNNFFPPAQIILGALVAFIFGACGYLPLRWPLIVLASFSFALILITALLFRKPFMAELRKKMQR